jgi:hypothetical protein
MSDNTFPTDPDVQKALEHLAVVLSENRMSASVVLHAGAEPNNAEFTLGVSRKTNDPHSLHARPATGEASHLGIDDF